MTEPSFECTGVLAKRRSGCSELWLLAARLGPAVVMRMAKARRGHQISQDNCDRVSVLRNEILRIEQFEREPIQFLIVPVVKSVQINIMRLKPITEDCDIERMECAQRFERLVRKGSRIK